MGERLNGNQIFEQFRVFLFSEAGVISY